MAVVGDSVLYFAPASDVLPAQLVAATLTAFASAGAVLFLQGSFYLGYVVAPQWVPSSPEPIQPGQWMERAV